MSVNAEAIRATLAKYAEPEPAVVTQIPRGIYKVDAVGHAEITRILLEIDPEFNWEPQAWAEDGGPRIVYRTPKAGKEQMVMWGFFTLHGKTMPCVGTCEATKEEADKELIGDLLRNGAMRFGISLNLWSKAERANPDYQPRESDNEANPVPRTRPAEVAEAFQVATEELRKPEAKVSAHAIEVMAEALDCDDPVGAPPEGVTIERWMWKLAELSDERLDGLGKNWTKVARDADVKPADLLDRAQEVARELKKGGTLGTHAPEKLEEIHGPVARELRRKLLSFSLPF